MVSEWWEKEHELIAKGEEWESKKHLKECKKCNKEMHKYVFKGHKPFYACSICDIPYLENTEFCQGEIQ